MDKHAILKIFDDNKNFSRETIALKLLDNKNMPTPKVIYCGDIHNQYYVIMEYLEGENLLDLFATLTYEDKSLIITEVGIKLAELNTCVSPREIEASGLWRYGYDGILSYSSYHWLNLYTQQLFEWAGSIIKQKDDDIDFFKAADILNQSIDYIDSDTAIGLVHRDYGFRNILIANNKVSGIIDFEYAIMGDILFDVSKLVFNNLDFNSDRKLVNVFLQNWSKISKQAIDLKRLWVYLAIQGFGAIQWVDKQSDNEYRTKNIDYRNNGRNILAQAISFLKDTI